jgi:hypothetical protein
LFQPVFLVKVLVDVSRYTPNAPAVINYRFC